MTGEARGDGGRPAALDARQKKLVADNLGLVGVHLAKHVGPIPRPRYDREREDLFQEGCLGLMRAAQAYDPRSSIPFAAFALMRIRNAVSRALQRRFRGRPAYTHPIGRKSADRGDTPSTTELAEPRIRQLSAHDVRCLAARSTAEPPAAAGETIGDRLRLKYRRAVGAAVATISRRRCRRDDHRQLVRVLVKDRFLVPNGHDRRALRQIARETRSSYARVAGCDRRLSAFIRRWLEADPEFRTLREAARHSPAGTGCVIDESLERELAACSCDTFVTRFVLADTEDRSRLLARLLALPGAPTPDLLLRRHVAALPHASRQRLWALEEADAVRSSPRRRSA